MNKSLLINKIKSFNKNNKQNKIKKISNKIINQYKLTNY